jgi:hypothetical protein
MTKPQRFVQDLKRAMALFVWHALGEPWVKQDGASSCGPDRSPLNLAAQNKKRM